MVDEKFHADIKDYFYEMLEQKRIPKRLHHEIVENWKITKEEIKAKYNLKETNVKIVGPALIEKALGLMTSAEKLLYSLQVFSDRELLEAIYVKLYV